MIKLCEYCEGRGFNYKLENSEDVWDGHADPQFEKEPCEECGGSGKADNPVTY